MEVERNYRDVFSEAAAIHELARTYVLVGDRDAALEHLEWLLSHPSEVSVPLLRVDPLWWPLHADARLRALLAKYEHPSR